MSDFTPDAFNYFIDFNEVEFEFNLKDLFSNSFSFLKPLLDDLHWVTANCVYLNLVCGLQQSEVAKILGISQFAVSKRMRGGILKLKSLLMRPESGDRVFLDLGQILGSGDLDIMTLLYFYRTYSQSGFFHRNVTESTLRLKVFSILDYMESLVGCSNNREDFLTQLRSEKPVRMVYVLNNIDNDAFYFMLVRMVSRYLSYFRYLLSEVGFSDMIFKSISNNRSSMDFDSFFSFLKLNDGVVSF